jgi:hypothetical protein
MKLPSTGFILMEQGNQRGSMTRGLEGQKLRERMLYYVRSLITSLAPAPAGAMAIYKYYLYLYLT